MKKFVFTLEAVRTLRRRQEHVAVDEYSRALLSRRQAMEQVEEMDRQLERNSQELRDVLSAGCTAAHAFQLSNYHRFLEKQQEQRMAVLAAAEKRLETAFQALLVARQQREVVETYRKKQRAIYQRRLVTEEQKELDETAGRGRPSILAWSEARDNAQ